MVHRNNICLQAETAPLGYQTVGPVLSASRMGSPPFLSVNWSRGQDKLQSIPRHASRLAIVFLLYVAAGKLGLAVPFTDSNVSPVWPAAGIAVAGILLFGVEVAPAIAGAAFLVNFFSPIPKSVAICIGLGNALSAVCTSYLLAQLPDFKLSLPRIKDVSRFVLIAAIAATTVSAIIGVSALAITHTKAWSGYGSAWRIWWLGDAMGVLVVAPLALAWRELIRVCRGWRALELFVVSAGVLGASLVIFGRWTAVRDDVLAFIVFPFVVWAAIRFRIGGAALTSLLSASIAVWGTARGFGPFVNHAPIRNAELLQVFIAVTTLSGLVLAAVINEREQIAKADVAKRRLLDLANDGIFVRDANSLISYWNEGAERLYGWTAEEALGRSTHGLLQTEYPINLSVILSMDRWNGELKHRRKDGSQIVVESRWTKVFDANGTLLGWLEVNTDITARKEAEEAARSLAGRILTLQDEERRKIARELHDSLGQYLAAAKMSLGFISLDGVNQSALISECTEILDKCLSETRTISHLLHPPLLDEAGFSSAARWFVDGFAKRSGVAVSLQLPAEPVRMGKDVEVALFRALQEGLTSVHKHSGATEVQVQFESNEEKIRFKIQDNGQGIAPARRRIVITGAAFCGVGIAGMRERVRELGGSLEIRSTGRGTTLMVTIPCNRPNRSERVATTEP